MAAYCKRSAVDEAGIYVRPPSSVVWSISSLKYQGLKYLLERFNNRTLSLPLLTVTVVRSYSFKILKSDPLLFQVRAKELVHPLQRASGVYRGHAREGHRPGPCER